MVSIVVHMNTPSYACQLNITPANVTGKLGQNNLYVWGIFSVMCLLPSTYSCIYLIIQPKVQPNDILVTPCTEITYYMHIAYSYNLYVQ